MGFSFNILFLGCLLIGQQGMSREQNYPKPSISVRPDNVVALGGDFTILCKSNGHEKMEFRLCKDMSASVHDVHIRVAENEEVAFSIVDAKLSDGGTYRCIYSHGQRWSFYSDKVKINVTDVPKQTEPMAAPQTIAIWTSCAAVLLLVLVLMLFAFLLYRRRTMSSTDNERKKPLNMPLEPEAGAGFEEVSYVVLNQRSLKTKWAANPDTVPESCVYASLAKDRTRVGQ